MQIVYASIIRKINKSDGRENIFINISLRKVWLHNMLEFYCHHYNNNIDVKKFNNQNPNKKRSASVGRCTLERFCIFRFVDIQPIHAYEYTLNKF